jgi:NADH:ubiquinone oxidoreductase subunit C
VSEGVGWLPGDAAQIFGEGAAASEAYDVLTVDVPPGEAWPNALRTARDELGCRFLDWLSAVDEPGEPGGGLRVCAHVVAIGTPGTPPKRLLLRTTLPREGASLPSATGVYPGAAWHERETHEMFGVDFPGHPGLEPLLLPEGFEGHPLRKDFVLAARVVKAWPGAKEPGEPAHGGPRRRQMLPPGVPDPNEWGPLKGQLPDAPARPPRARATRAERADRPARPARPRRTRSASEGSASQRGEAPSGEDSASQQGRPADAPWRGPGRAEGSAGSAADAPADPAKPESGGGDASDPGKEAP